MSENIVIASIIFYRIEMENQKLLYRESSDEEDGPSA